VLLQRAAGEVLHDDVRQGVVEMGLVDLHDVVVAHPRQQPGLALEALAHGLADRRRALALRQLHELHRHGALQRQVGGLPDLAHRATAELAHELEVRPLQAGVQVVASFGAQRYTAHRLPPDHAPHIPA